MSKISKYQFPWESGNQFELLADGQQFFPEMIHQIEKAQHYILMEMYLVASGHIASLFIEALTAASNRGVQSLLLFDDFGCRDLSGSDRARLSTRNMTLCFYNPFHYSRFTRSMLRDHRKILVVDGRTAFVGGAGLIDEFDSMSFPDSYWRDNMVKITGSNVSQWQQLFLHTWQHWSTENIPFMPTQPHPAQQPGRVTITSGPHFQEIKRSFLNFVNHAEKRVWFCTAYFLPTRKLIRSLKKAVTRGVDVRILIPGQTIDHGFVRYMAQSYYTRLLKKGIRIFEYQPRFLHAKTIFCDHWVSIGSCNLDRWEFLWNLDANQEVNHPLFSEQVTTMFLTDFSHSSEITLSQWKQIGWVQRLKIYFYARAKFTINHLLSTINVLNYWKSLHPTNKKP